MPKIPENFKKLYSKEDISKAIERVAKEVAEWIADTDSPEDNRDVLALPVLRGGLYFFSDLSRAIDRSLDCNPIQSWAYQGEHNTALPSGVAVNLSDFPVRGRRVLVVDDICDSGRTLEAIRERLMDKGAREVVAAVLIERGGNEPAFAPQWVGFQYPGPEWFVGYGMDDGGRWRNLPEIYTVE